MEYFLQHIAKSLYSEFGNNLNSHCLVFPGRRAGLFFLKYLAEGLKGPVWTPSIITINDLFRSYSQLQLGENEILLFELYRVYSTITKTKESFDDFYFWGDMLLNDFDDVDKYLVDAGKLFRNVYDLKRIDQQFGGLSPEQGEIIKQFWVNFNPEKQTDEKIKFLSIWSGLFDIYTGFRKNLIESNLAYEGMLFRDVIEKGSWKQPLKKDWDMFHFIGFNALNECEKEIMSGLKAERKARFYWDYDNSYISPGKLNSAGYFLKDNLASFGNDMPAGWEYDTCLSANTGNIKRRIIDTSSDIAQVKLLTRLLGELTGLSVDYAHQTAVVLCDENLLMPVLTSLPENLPDVNITMGYPLKQTSVYSLIRLLLEMQENAQIKNGEAHFNFRDVIAILKNSLIGDMINGTGEKIVMEINERNLFMIPAGRFADNEILSIIFRKPTKISETSEYLKSILTLIATSEPKNNDKIAGEILPSGIRNEFIYRAILSINRLMEVSSKSDITFTVLTWSKILDRLLRAQSVPFSGEPLTGIQIMGILETRTLDFKNLIILSVNEGILPSITGASSFIPFSLREAFRIPSINHQESIYAYHFYRLLHRAENVTLIYNSNPEGLRSGEMSRFLQQMKYDTYLTPDLLNLNFEIKNPMSVGTIVERTAEHNRLLYSRFSVDNGRNKLSPLAINLWLHCRMKFYYRYVSGLKEPDRITEEIDPSVLGILLHECMKTFYEGFAGREVRPDDISPFLNNNIPVSELISSTIHEKFRKGNDSLLAINETIVKNVLQIYLSRILEADIRIAPFKIRAVEKPVDFKLSFAEGGSDRTVAIGGIIDRVDMKNGITRIVDYKTGTTSDSIASVSFLFEDDRQKDSDGWLQTLLYCEGYLAGKPGSHVMPSVYKVKKIASENVNDKLYIKVSKKDGFFVDDYSKVRDEFIEGLKGAVKSIFSPEENFRMTPDKRNKCSYCPYRGLCMR